MCTCDSGNALGRMVWRITNGTQNVCNMTLNQTVYACTNVSATCSANNGFSAINEDPLMTGAQCDTSILNIDMTLIKNLNGLKIICTNPIGTTYGSITRRLPADFYYSRVCVLLKIINAHTCILKACFNHTVRFMSSILSQPLQVFLQ